jgi:protein-disulfide isomerase
MIFMSEEKKSGQIIVSKLTIALFAIIVLLAGALGFLVSEVINLKKNPSTTTQTATTQQPATIDLATIKGLWDKNIVKFGDKDRKVLFVEVADPSCPYCHVANGQDPEIAAQIGSQFTYASKGGSYVPPVPEMKKLVDEGKASYAFVYFPGHGNGEMGTKALWCAQDQGKFWDAEQLLYSYNGYNLMNTTVQNDKTKSGLVADFLKGVLDSKALKTCIDSGKYDSRLTEEQNLASTLAAAGTPGFFVNDTRFDGAYSWNDMKAAVDAALK